MRRMILTPAINLAYAYPTAATSAVGFDSLKMTKGASAPKLSLGAFFSPKGFLFGGMQWEAFGLAGFLWRRSVNPLYAVAIIFDRIGQRLVITKPLETPIMNVFTVRSSATLLELAEQARIRTIQTYTLAETINSLADTHDDLQDYQRYSTVTNLMWILQDLLEQLMDVSELLSKAVKRGGGVL